MIKKLRRASVLLLLLLSFMSFGFSVTGFAAPVPGQDLGIFKLTAYCPCSICCGEYAGGPTASGVYPTAGQTIAVDPDVIPLGSWVDIYLQGYGWCRFRAEDTGSAIKGNDIDIYVPIHAAANFEPFNGYAQVRYVGY